MNATKQQYLGQVRSNTAYPTYRAIVEIITVLGYIQAGFYALVALIAGLGGMRNSFLMGLGILVGGGLLAALTFFLAKFWKEASLILADMGDSITDMNSRSSGLR